MKTPNQNRESWLNHAVALLRPRFAAQGLGLPEHLRVSTGWPSRGGMSERKRVIGQCWKPEAAVDSFTHIFISPYLEDRVNVLETLVHELIHAALPDAKHGPDFKDAMKKLGLTGKATATAAGDELKAQLSIMAEELGDYDHGKLGLGVPSDTPKQQKGRQKKIFCPNKADHKDETDVIYRASKKVIDLGLPCCPLCGEQMVAEEETESEGDGD